MTTAFRTAARLAVLAVTAALAGGPAWANPNPDLPSPMETVQLPPYCQTQFTTGQVAIPAACGAFMNHFCSGLVFLGRANDFAAPKSRRQYAARRAREDINYTRDHMAPGCSITGAVQAADMRLKALEIFLK